MSLKDEITAAAKRYGIDPDIFYRQIMAESSGNPNAGSPAGARGIAQFMPGTAQQYGVDLDDGSYFDDLDGAARYMRDLLNMFGGDYAKALAGYNAGPGTVQKYGGVPPMSFANGETYNYVQKILGSNGMPTGAEEQTYQGVLAKIQELNANAPEFGSEDWETWLAELTYLTSAAKALRPEGSGNSQDQTAVQDFQNRINQFSAGIAYDQQNLARAIADIDRFLGLREESRARASAIQSGQEMRQRYGTAPGKSTFSANDLGAAFGTFADILGIDRGSQDFARYSGTMRVDPEADMARFDSLLGVEGAPPELPGMYSTPDMIPGSPDLIGAGLPSVVEQGTAHIPGAAAPSTYGTGDYGIQTDPDLSPAQTYFPKPTGKVAANQNKIAQIARAPFRYD